MKRQGFILGVLSIGGQVLLLRELVSSLNGDELFIGTALFGWLVSVAIGAYIGGRSKLRVRPAVLFVIGAALIPVMIVAVRLSPLAVTDLTGQLVPFVTSILISTLAMFPVGLVSGWLFPVITHRAVFPVNDAIVTVYLYEGIGAFVGGIGITLLTGELMSALTLGTVMAVVIIAVICLSRTPQRMIAAGVIVIALFAAAILAVPHLDGWADDVKYASYDVQASFDTHYGHQTILSRDNSLALMTDNEIEAVYPDVETAENQIIVPLLYHPDAGRVLYIGRAEFGAAQLAETVGDINFIALDPRESLTDALHDVTVLPAGGFVTTHDDPIAYLTTSSVMSGYDIIIVNPGEPDSYRTARLFTPSFFGKLGMWLAEDGIIIIPTGYDTDRYIAPEKKEALSVIYRTLAKSFPEVYVWPGTMTLFLASRSRPLDQPVDTIVARLGNLAYAPRYLSEYHIRDRLASLKTDRLTAAITRMSESNSVIRPVLPHYHALYRSLTDSVDKALLRAILHAPVWTLILPLAIMGFFARTVRGRRRYARFGLFLYFTAGIVSLSLELISFYVYQTAAGSLYAEMAALIGAFMFGLAVGAYYSQRIGDGPLEFPALLVMLVSAVLFLFMYDDVSPGAILFFHAGFLFVTAVATATLFVGATNRYYGDVAHGNRGTGYALEIFGSSMGAIFTLTVLLPAIGLTWVLICLIGLIILALIGSMITASHSRALVL